MRNGAYTGPQANFFTLRDTSTGVSQRFLGRVYQGGLLSRLTLGAPLQYELGNDGWCSRVVKGAAAAGFESVAESRAASPRRAAVFHGPKRGYFLLLDADGKRRRFSSKAYLSGDVRDLKKGDQVRFEMHDRGGWCLCVERA